MARPPSVAKLKRKGDVNALVDALRYRDLVRDQANRPVDLGGRVRIEALTALVELGGEAAREPVVAALADPLPEVRIATVRALWALGPGAAAEPLARGVVGWPAPPYGGARDEALRALTDCVDGGLVDTVVEAIVAQERDEQLDEVTERAFALLVRRPLGGEETARLLVDKLLASNGARSRVETMLTWTGAAAAEVLIARLSEPGLRESAARVLGALKAADAVPGLIGCLSDQNPAVRRAATGALAEIRDPRAIEALIRATSDDDFRVRDSAQAALDGLGTVSIVAGLSALLRPALTGSMERLAVEGQASEPS